jgi:hypothetical protein
LLVRKLNRDVTLPGAVARGVGAAASVVVGEPSGDIGREADVEVVFTSGTLENVTTLLLSAIRTGRQYGCPKGRGLKGCAIRDARCDRCSFCDVWPAGCCLDLRIVQSDLALGHFARLAEPKLVDKTGTGPPSRLRALRRGSLRLHS